MLRTPVPETMSGIRAHMLASSNAGQDANSDVSAIFDELTVELRSQPKSSSEIRQSAYLQHKADFQELVTKGARLFKLMIAESTSSAQSSFTDVEDLQKWGYDTYNYNDASELRGIDSVLDTIEWPGTTYYPGSNEFNALLGSPNGQGVAHMLIQHRKQLGHKTVEKVIVFFIACRGKMLLFHLQDVEETSRHDACS
ncbi:unnamed protein product [Alternaria alternata]